MSRFFLHTLLIVFILYFYFFYFLSFLFLLTKCSPSLCIAVCCCNDAISPNSILLVKNVFALISPLNSSSGDTNTNNMEAHWLWLQLHTTSRHSISWETNTEEKKREEKGREVPSLFLRKAFLTRRQRPISGRQRHTSHQAERQSRITTIVKCEWALLSQLEQGRGAEGRFHRRTYWFGSIAKKSHGGGHGRRRDRGLPQSPPHTRQTEQRLLLLLLLQPADLRGAAQPGRCLLGLRLQLVHRGASGAEEAETHALESRGESASQVSLNK